MRRRLGQLGLPAALLLIAGLGTWWLLRPDPSSDFEAPTPPEPIVRVQVVELSTQRQIVSGSGAVGAARSLAASAAVSGQVAWLHSNLEPGGVIEKGQVYLRLDPRPFQLEVDQRKAELVQAEADLARAKGQHRAAQRSFELLRGEGADLDPALARREPELRAAEARLAGARAALDRAELDLAWTRVSAPFDALVLEKMVELGEQVGPSTELARFAAADVFWVRVPISLRDAAFVEAQAVGRRVEVQRTMTPGAEVLEGRLVRITGAVDEVGRLVDALVALDQPLAAEPPVKLGEFVDVRFQSDRQVAGVRLPRRALRGGDQVYVVDAEESLRVRPVHVAWGDRTTVVIDDGLRTGERVITSRMGVALPGMSLEVAPPAPPTGTRG